MYLILRPLHSIANVTLYMFDLTQMKYISRFRPCVRYDRRRGEYTVDLSRWPMMMMTMVVVIVMIMMMVIMMAVDTKMIRISFDKSRIALARMRRFLMIFIELTL